MTSAKYTYGTKSPEYMNNTYRYKYQKRPM